MSLNVKQIPPHIGYYVAGFTDGEGSFNVVFRKRKDYRMPWKVSACFNVSQRDRVILALLKRYIGCGTLRQRRDGVWYYEVNNLTALRENVIPFFNRYGFLSSKKKRDFSKFKQIVQLLQDKMHLRREGIERILKIRSDMNDGGAERRKYSDADILELFVREEDPQRLHAESD
jgi:LAGLIDADG DNA endonuclease family protein